MGKTYMENRYRDIIAVDFDGVLHDYDGGFQGDDVVTGDANMGSIGWLIGICQYTPYDVVIHSCRCLTEGGKEAIESWIYDQVKAHLSMCDHYNYEEGYQELEDDLVGVCASIVCSAVKPRKAFIFIDDRAWKFNGTFPSLTELKSFKPWYK